MKTVKMGWTGLLENFISHVESLESGVCRGTHKYVYYLVRITLTVQLLLSDFKLVCKEQRNLPWKCYTAIPTKQFERYDFRTATLAGNIKK